MSHGNARLTVHGRFLIVQRHRQGWRQAHIAAAMGVSRKCVKTWTERYAAEGEADCVTGPLDHGPHRLRRRPMSSGASSSCASTNDAGRTGTAPSSVCRHEPCRGSCADTRCRTGVSNPGLEGECGARRTGQAGRVVYMDVKRLGRIHPAWPDTARPGFASGQGLASPSSGTQPGASRVPQPCRPRP